MFLCSPGSLLTRKVLNYLFLVTQSYAENLRVTQSQNRAFNRVTPCNPVVKICNRSVHLFIKLFVGDKFNTHLLLSPC
jgi:hypothetical protein